MDLVTFAWLVSLIAAAWLMPLGIIRVLGYHAGDTDRTPGMRPLARLTVALAVAATAVFFALTVLRAWVER